MAEVQDKFADALKSIKGAQAAPAYDFHDLAGDALGKLRRGLLACDGHALAIRNADALDVVDFLVKCTERKTRKSQVIECLGFLIVKSNWAKAINSSHDIRSSVEVLLDGNQALLHALATPLSDSKDSSENESGKLAKQINKMSPEDFDLVVKYLNSAYEDMVAAGWAYRGHSDKANSGFRCLYNAIVKIISSNGTSVDDLMFATFHHDWQNVVCFLKSLHDGRKSVRSQITYVVEKLSTLSGNFLAALQETSSLPWQSYSNPSTPDGSDDEAKCIGANSNPIILNETTSVLVRVGACQPVHKGVQITHSNGFEVHWFHDDSSRGNARVHIDVLAHIMDLVLSHQTTKQVVSVQIDKEARYPHMFQDVHSFFQARGLATPQYIAL